MAFLGFHSFWELNAYITFVMLGMSIMMVLSSILGAPSFVASYYIYATGNPDAKCEKPYFWNNVLTFFSAILYIVQFTCECLSLTPLVRRIPLRLRLIVGLTIPFFEMIILVIIPTITIPTQNGAIAVVMAVAVMSGFSKAACDSTTNALAAPFPTKFVNGEQWGLAISPVLMSIVQIILMGSMSDNFHDVLVQSRIYFGIGIFFQILTLIQLLILDKNPFAQKYAAEFRFRAQQRANASGSGPHGARHAGEPNNFSAFEKPSSGTDDHGVTVQANGSVGVMADGSTLIDTELKGDQRTEQMGVGLSDTKNTAGNKHHSASTAILRATGDADNMVDADQVDNITSTEQMLEASAISVIKRIWPMLFCTFSIYFTSLILFPGLFLKVATDMSGWYPTLVVFVFNVGDFLSRIVLMFRSLRPSPKGVLAGTLARLLIIPLLALCCAHVIKGNAVPYILALLLSLTNGYFGTMAYMHSPRTPTLSKAGERSLAGILSGIFLMLGLCIGSNSALLVNLLF